MAADFAPASVTCVDSEGTCLKSSDGVTPVDTSLYRDSDNDTGDIIDGPNYNIIMTLNLGGNYDITKLTIWHKSFDVRIGASTFEDSEVQYSTNGTDWTTFANIPSYGGIWDLSADVYASATANYLRIIDSKNNSYSAEWGPTEFIITGTSTSVPEMEFWALILILPIMFYVTYKVVPKRLTNF
ncbi:hypothetical protein HN748_02570 [Candidatus Peregrinibacteria bacterium]|nr:hypothetical protein [Candidatus Peregrinibacteria bacterium]MBT7483528.1 hypothetical protein [Candidatus Peregrinibacteria bacterium]MBT7703092.1 hypothetical protein [Candidatus Peregrinibacteria bacterium]